MATLVTCASGFVSRAFTRALRLEGERTRVLIRDPLKRPWFAGEEVIVGDMFDPYCLAAAVSGMDAIIHVPPALNPGGDAQSQLALHRWSQVESTRLVLDKAAKQGVGKFLFISSAHATGRSSRKALCELAAQEPESAYARAKLEAEKMVLSYAKDHSMQAIILRPPGIYGPGDKSVISALRRAAERNLWLPLKGLGALHSLVFVDSLARAGLELLKAAKMRTGSRVYIVKDPIDYSPEELYSAICRGMGKKVMLFQAPRHLLRFLGFIGGKCRNIPKLGWLNLLRQLLISERYCGHLFTDTLPHFAFVSLDQAIEKSSDSRLAIGRMEEHP